MPTKAVLNTMKLLYKLNLLRIMAKANLEHTLGLTVLRVIKQNEPPVQIISIRGNGHKVDHDSKAQLRNKNWIVIELWQKRCSNPGRLGGTQAL